MTADARDRLLSLGVAFVFAAITTAVAAAAGLVFNGDPAHVSVGFVFGVVFVDAFRDLRR